MPRPTAYLSLLFSLAFLLLPSLPAVAQPEYQPFLLKFGTLAPVNSAWTIMPEKLLLPLIQDMFNGGIKPLIYYGGAMGDDKDILRKMKLGQLHACCCTNEGTVKAVPELSVFSLPLLFRSYDEVDYVTRRLRDRIASLFENRGYYLLFIVDTGFLYFFSKNDPSTLDQIRRQRIFSWFGEIQVKTYQGLGINPVPLAITELAPSISSGLTDAGVGPASWLLATQMYTHINYVLEPPLFYGLSTGFINKKQLDHIVESLARDPARFQKLQREFEAFKQTLPAGNLLEQLELKDSRMEEAAESIFNWIRGQDLNTPEDVLTILLGLFKAGESAWLRSIRDFEAECFRGFFQRGIKQVRLQADDHSRLDQISRQVWTELSGPLFPPDLLEQILKLLAEYRAENQGHTGPENKGSLPNQAPAPG